MKKICKCGSGKRFNACCARFPGKFYKRLRRENAVARMMESPTVSKTLDEQKSSPTQEVSLGDIVARMKEL